MVSLLSLKASKTLSILSCKLSRTQVTNQAFSGMKVSPTVQGEVTFMLSDDVMAENEGIYTLSCRQGEMVMEREKGEKKVLFHIDIACLTSLLFGSVTFSSLREEGILLMKDEEIAWLNGIFGGEKNWINEWF